MASELRSINPSPVQIWGTRETEDRRRLASERRPQRTCASCPALLSRYNPDPLCGACEKREWELKASMQAHPAEYVPEIKQCGWCRSSFKARTAKRRVCYACIPQVVGG